MEDLSPGNCNVVCEWSHSRHDGHWTVQFRDEMQEREQLLCIACVIEMVEENSVSVRSEKVYYN